jgi:hypothetical protein
MNLKTKTLIGILVMGITLITGWWGWSGKVYSKTSEVAITTDKTEYVQREIVKVNIVNLCSQDIVFFEPRYGGIFLEKKLLDETWSDEYLDFPPAGELSPIILKPHSSGKLVQRSLGHTARVPQEIYEFEWDQKTIDTKRRSPYRKFVTSGVYRFKLSYGYDTLGQSDWKTAYSDEFTITEKRTKEATIIIDKTEYEQGEKITATLNYKGEIYQRGRYAWSIQKWENDSWVAIQRRDDPYFFCANIPECKDVSLEEFKECPPILLCERERWYKVEGTPKLVWDQSYKIEERTFQCKSKIGKIDVDIKENRTCAIFDQVTLGRYKIRFEYATFIKPDDFSYRVVDIEYAEKEIIIK